MRRLCLAGAAGLLMSACAHERTEMVPAMLDSASPEQVGRLSTALSAHLGRSNIKFGPGLVAGAGQLTVSPPPPADLETHSLAMPETYRLVLSDTMCVAIHQGSAAEIPLPGVLCSAVQKAD